MPSVGQKGSRPAVRTLSFRPPCHIRSIQDSGHDHHTTAGPDRGPPVQLGVRTRWSGNVTADTTAAPTMVTKNLPIGLIVAFSPLELFCTSKHAPGCTYSQHNAHECANCEISGTRIEKNLKCVTHCRFF